MDSNKIPDFAGLGRPNLPPSKQERKAVRKVARKALGRTLLALAKGLTLHYGVSLAGVAVIAASGFHGVFRAALSATALGLLARWFLPNQAGINPAALRQPVQPAGVVELTPDQLKEFFNGLSEVSDGDHVHYEASPYL